MFELLGSEVFQRGPNAPRSMSEEKGTAGVCQRLSTDNQVDARH